MSPTRGLSETPCLWSVLLVSVDRKIPTSSILNIGLLLSLPSVKQHSGKIQENQRTPT